MTLTGFCWMPTAMDAIALLQPELSLSRVRVLTRLLCYREYARIGRIGSGLQGG